MLDPAAKDLVENYAPAGYDTAIGIVEHLQYTPNTSRN